jgi:hypothetical protein
LFVRQIAERTPGVEIRARTEDTISERVHDIIDAQLNFLSLDKTIIASFAKRIKFSHQIFIIDK